MTRRAFFYVDDKDNQYLVAENDVQNFEQFNPNARRATTVEDENGERHIMRDPSKLQEYLAGNPNRRETQSYIGNDGKFIGKNADDEAKGRKEWIAGNQEELSRKYNETTGLFVSGKKKQAATDAYTRFLNTDNAWKDLGFKEPPREGMSASQFAQYIENDDNFEDDSIMLPEMDFTPLPDIPLPMTMERDGERYELEGDVWRHKPGQGSKYNKSEEFRHDESGRKLHSVKGPYGRPMWVDDNGRPGIPTYTEEEEAARKPLPQQPDIPFDATVDGPRAYKKNPYVGIAKYDGGESEIYEDPVTHRRQYLVKYSDEVDGGIRHEDGEMVYHHSGYFRDADTGKVLSPDEVSATDPRVIGWEYDLKGKSVTGSSSHLSDIPHMGQSRTQEEEYLTQQYRNEAKRELRMAAFGIKNSKSRVKPSDLIPQTFGLDKLVARKELNDYIETFIQHESWNGEGEEPEQLDPLSEAWMMREIAREQHSRTTGDTFGAQVTRGVANLLPFAFRLGIGEKSVEAITGSLASKYGSTAVGQFFTSKIAGKVIGKLVSETATLALQQGLSSAEIAEGTLERMQRGYVPQVDDKGNFTLTDNGTGMSMEAALKNSFWDMAIENTSERFGEWMVGGFSRLAGKEFVKSRKGLAAICKFFASVENFTSPKSAMLHSVSGFPSEWIEERVGGFMRGMAGIDMTDEELKTPWFKRAINATMPATWDDAAVELAVLGLPSAWGTVRTGIAAGAAQQYHDEIKRLEDRRTEAWNRVRSGAASAGVDVGTDSDMAPFVERIKGAMSGNVDDIAWCVNALEKITTAQESLLSRIDDISNEELTDFDQVENLQKAYSTFLAAIIEGNRVATENAKTTPTVNDVTGETPKERADRLLDPEATEGTVEAAKSGDTSDVLENSKQEAHGKKRNAVTEFEELLNEIGADALENGRGVELKPIVVACRAGHEAGLSPASIYQMLRERNVSRDVALGALANEFKEVAEGKLPSLVSSLTAAVKDFGGLDSDIAGKSLMSNLGGSSLDEMADKLSAYGYAVENGEDLLAKLRQEQGEAPVDNETKPQEKSGTSDELSDWMNSDRSTIVKVNSLKEGDKVSVRGNQFTVAGVDKAGNLLLVDRTGAPFALMTTTDGGENVALIDTDSVPESAVTIEKEWLKERDPNNTSLDQIVEKPITSDQIETVSILQARGLAKEIVLGKTHLINYLDKAHPGWRQNYVKNGNSPDAFSEGGKVFVPVNENLSKKLFHEVTHEWEKEVRRKNPNLWKKGRQLMQELVEKAGDELDETKFKGREREFIKAWKRVIETEFYKAQSAKGDKEVFYDEALAYVIENHGEEILANHKFGQALAQWVLDFWEAIKSMIGFEHVTADQLRTMDWNEFTDLVVADILREAANRHPVMPTKASEAGTASSTSKDIVTQNVGNANVIPKSVNNGASRKNVMPISQAEKKRRAEFRYRGGPKWTATTPDGSMTVSGHYVLVENGTAHDSTHPDYDQRKQDRTGRGSSDDTQVVHIAQNLNGYRLLGSPTTDTGASIADKVGDLIVGNGRYIAINLSSKYGTEAEYEKIVKDFAKENGIEFDPDIQHPRLIRVLDTELTDDQMKKFITESNKSNKKEKDAAELAEEDMLIFSSEEHKNLLSKFHPGANGDLTAKSNEEFMNEFAKATGNDSLIAHKLYTEALQERVVNAIIAKLIGDFSEDGTADRTMIQMVTLGKKTLGIEKVVKGISRSAVVLLNLNGTEYAIGPDVSLALAHLVNAKRQKTPVGRYVANLDFFLKRNDLAADMAVKIDEWNSAAKIAKAFSEYARLSELQSQETESMFGDEKKSKMEVWKAAVENVENENRKGTIEEDVDESRASVENATEVDLPRASFTSDYDAIERTKAAIEPLVKKGKYVPVYIYLRQTESLIKTYKQRSAKYARDGYPSLAADYRDLARYERVSHDIALTVLNQDPNYVPSNELSVKPGVISLADVTKMFKATNNDKDLDSLYDKVAACADKLGIGIKIGSTDDICTHGYVAGGAFVTYDTKYLNSEIVPAQHKAQTLLHELLHSITNYAVYNTEHETGAHLSEELKNASRNFIKLYEECKADGNLLVDEDGKPLYGAKNVNEFIAELSNPEFRAQLKKKNIWQRIVNGIKQIFKAVFELTSDGKLEAGTKEMSALEASLDTLDTFLNSPDLQTFGRVKQAALRVLNAKYTGGGQGKVSVTPSENAIKPVEAERKQVMPRPQTASTIKQDTLFDDSVGRASIQANEVDQKYSKLLASGISRSSERLSKFVNDYAREVGAIKGDEKVAPVLRDDDGEVIPLSIRFSTSPVVFTGKSQYANGRVPIPFALVRRYKREIGGAGREVANAILSDFNASQYKADVPTTRLESKDVKFVTGVSSYSPRAFSQNFANGMDTPSTRVVLTGSESELRKWTEKDDLQYRKAGWFGLAMRYGDEDAAARFFRTVGGFLSNEFWPNVKRALGNNPEQALIVSLQPQTEDGKPIDAISSRLAVMCAMAGNAKWCNSGNIEKALHSKAFGGNGPEKIVFVGSVTTDFGTALEPLRSIPDEYRDRFAGIYDFARHHESGNTQKLAVKDFIYHDDGTVSVDWAAKAGPFHSILNALGVSPSAFRKLDYADSFLAYCAGLTPSGLHCLARQIRAIMRNPPEYEDKRQMNMGLLRRILKGGPRRKAVEKKYNSTVFSDVAKFLNFSPMNMKLPYELSEFFGRSLPEYIRGKRLGSAEQNALGKFYDDPELRSVGFQDITYAAHNDTPRLTPIHNTAIEGDIDIREESLARIEQLNEYMDQKRPVYVVYDVGEHLPDNFAVTIARGHNDGGIFHDYGIDLGSEGGHSLSTLLDIPAGAQCIFLTHDLGPKSSVRKLVDVVCRNPRVTITDVIPLEHNGQYGYLGANGELLESVNAQLDKLGHNPLNVDDLAKEFKTGTFTPADIAKALHERYNDLELNLNDYQVKRYASTEQWIATHEEKPAPKKSVSRAKQEEFDFGRASIAKDGMYSKLERVVEADKQNKYSTETLVPFLKGRGVKDVEIKVSGLQAFLADKESVSKEELAQWIREHNYILDRSELSETLAESRRNEIKRKNESTIDYIRDEYYHLSDYRESVKAGDATLRDMNGEVLASFTREDANSPWVGGYESYSDGMEFTSSQDMYQYLRDTYTELVNQAIEEAYSNGDMLNEDDEWSTSEYEYWSLPGGENYREVLFEDPHVVWKSPHWKSDKVVAHTRLQDFTTRTSDGGDKRVLFVEEVQSDLHQKGRESGYQPSFDDKEAAFEKARAKEMEKRAVLNRLSEEFGVDVDILGSGIIDIPKNIEKIESDPRAKEMYNEFLKLKQETADLSDAFRKMERDWNNGVPDVPYKNTWHEYVMKQNIREACENGYDYVAWTTGRQQADRYDLTKHVDNVNWKSYDFNGTPGKLVRIVLKVGSRYTLSVSNDGIVTDGWGDDNFVGKKLEDIVGKNITRQVDSEESGEVSGDGLTVGGEGMHNFYDVGGKSSQNIPKFIQKYIRQWGGKLEDIELNNGETVVGFKVTDEMREDVTDNGQPRFSFHSDEENKKIAGAYIAKLTPVEGKRLQAAIDRNYNTPWHHQVIESILIRDDIENAMAGRPLANSKLNAPSAARVLDFVRRGESGIFDYLMMSGVIGHADKPVNAVNSTFINCDPSESCAKYCYAARGNYAYISPAVKSELISWAVEHNPRRVADIIAREYSAMPEHSLGKALRLFDKGDISEDWLPVIEALNSRGIATQIFSKRPEILKRVDSKANVIALSVDHTNLDIADKYPDLPIAYVYEGTDDLPFIEKNEKRFMKYGGVILPVKNGNQLLPPDVINALPKWARRFTCPIDAGWRVLKYPSGTSPASMAELGPTWHCTSCDAAGGIGCFAHRSAAIREQYKNQPLNEMERSEFDAFCKEYREALEKVGSAALKSQLLHELDNIRSQVLAGRNPEAEGTVVQEPGEVHGEESGNAGSGIVAAEGSEINYGGRASIVAPSGRQKLSSVTYPSAAEEIKSMDDTGIRFSFATDARDLLLKKRPDLMPADEANYRNRYKDLGQGDWYDRYGVNSFSDGYRKYLNDIAVDETVGEICKFKDSKTRKAALHWIINGSIQLPEDAYKVEQALSYGKNAKGRSNISTDAMSYDSPMAMMEALHEFKPKAKPIDPDTVPTLSDKRDMGHGVTTYLVDESRESQRAMRKIIDTHWGEDANPWCLLARTEGYSREGADAAFREWYDHLSNEEKEEYEGEPGAGFGESGVIGQFEDPEKVAYNHFINNVYRPDSLDDARRYWEHYNSLPKRVAFKDGKLLAFMATDYVDYDPDEPHDVWMAHNHREELLDEDNPVPEQWWDRQDQDHEGIPLGDMPVPNDKFGRWANYEIRNGRLERIGRYEKIDGKGNYTSWFDNGYKSREEIPGRTVSWYDDGFVDTYKEMDSEGETSFGFAFDSEGVPTRINDGPSNRAFFYNGMESIRGIHEDGIDYSFDESENLKSVSWYNRNKLEQITDFTDSENAEWKQKADRAIKKYHDLLDGRVAEVYGKYTQRDVPFRASIAEAGEKLNKAGTALALGGSKTKYAQAANEYISEDASDLGIRFSVPREISEAKRPRLMTMFSGGGTVEYGLRGLVKPVFAVEIRKKIANVYKQNHGGDHLFVGDVRDIDLKTLPETDMLWASPVCCNYSPAKPGNDADNEADITTAQAVADVIDEKAPRVVVIENVARYKKSQALKLITDSLSRNGYWFDDNIYNTADYGGATIRKRLLIRAVKDEFVPPVPLSNKRPTTWYDRLGEEYIESLPEAEKLPKWIIERMQNKNGISAEELAHPNWPILIYGSGDRGGGCTYSYADEPARTLLAHAGRPLIVLPDGRIKKVDARGTAKLTGLMDDYWLPDEFDLGQLVVGNGVPAELSRNVIGQLITDIFAPDEDVDEDSMRASIEIDEDGNQHDVPHISTKSLPSSARKVVSSFTSTHGIHQGALQEYGDAIARMRKNQNSTELQRIADRLERSDEPRQQWQARYLKAKFLGDHAAAESLLHDTLSRTAVYQIAQSVNKKRPVVLVPMVSDKNRGENKNVIPLVHAERLAEMLKEYGVTATVDTGIHDASSSSNTNSEKRLVNVKAFTGHLDNPQHAQVVIVDDVFTSGNSVYGIWEYIKHKHGDNVSLAAFTSLAGGQYSGEIATNQNTLNRIGRLLDKNPKGLKTILNRDPYEIPESAFVYFLRRHENEDPKTAINSFFESFGVPPKDQKAIAKVGKYEPPEGEGGFGELPLFDMRASIDADHVTGATVEALGAQVEEQMNREKAILDMASALIEEADRKSGREVGLARAEATRLRKEIAALSGDLSAEADNVLGVFPPRKSHSNPRVRQVLKRVKDAATIETRKFDKQQALDEYNGLFGTSVTTGGPASLVKAAFHNAYIKGKKEGHISFRIGDIPKMVREALDHQLRKDMAAPSSRMDDVRARAAKRNEEILEHLDQIELNVNTSSTPDEAVIAELGRVIGLSTKEVKAIMLDNGLKPSEVKDAFLTKSRKVIEDNLFSHYMRLCVNLFGGRDTDIRLPDGSVVKGKTKGKAREGLSKMSTDTKDKMAEILERLDRRITQPDGKVNIGALSWQEARDFWQEAMEQMTQSERDKQFVWQDHKARRCDLQDNIAAEVEAANKPLEGSEHGDQQMKVFSSRRGFFWTTTAMGTRALYLAGGNKNSTTYKLLYETMRDTQEKQMRAEMEDLTAMEEKQKACGFTRDKLLSMQLELVPVDIGTETIGLTRAEMMTVYAMTLDGDANLKLMHNGFAPNRFRTRPGEALVRGEGADEDARITDMQVKVGAIISQLSPEERDFVKWLVVDQAHVWARRGNETSREMLGYEMFNEDAPHFTLVGSVARDVASPDSFSGILSGGSGRSVFMESKGNVKERIAHTHPLLVRDIFRVARQQARDMSIISQWMGPYRDIKTVLSSGPSRAALAKVIGSRGITQISQTLDMLTSQGEQSRDLSGWQRALAKLGGNASVFILGGRLTSIALNRYGGYATLMGEMAIRDDVPGKALAEMSARILNPTALAKLSTARKEAYAKLMAHPYLWQRWNDANGYAVMGQLITDRLERQEEQAAENLKRAMREENKKRAAAFMLSGMTAAEIANGIDAYLSLIHSGVDSDAAVQIVAESTRATQNPSSPLEYTGDYLYSKSGGASTLLYAMTGQPAVQGDWAKRQLYLARQEIRSGNKSGYKRAAIILTSLVVTALVTQAIRGVVSAMSSGGGGDDDWMKKRNVEGFASELAGNVSSVGSQAAVSILMDAYDAISEGKKPHDGGDRGAPAMQAINDIVTAGETILTFIPKSIQGKDISQADVEKSLLLLGEGVGMATGVPLGGAEQLLKIIFGLSGHPIGKKKK